MNRLCIRLLAAAILVVLAGAPPLLVPAAAAVQPNFRISAGTSGRGETFLGLAFANGVFYPGWTDSSAALGGNPDSPPQNEMAIVAVRVDPNGSASVGPNLNISRAAGGQQLSSIALDPSDPSRIVAVGTSFNGSSADLIRALSTDGGATWTVGTVFPRGDEGQVAFDAHGNCFLAFIDRTFGIHQVRARLWMSSDGGRTFAAVAGFNPSHSAINPALAAGAGAVWVAFRDVGSPQIVVSGAAVTGRGAVGAFTTRGASGTGKAGRSDIAVGPTGQVMLAYLNTPDPAPHTVSVQVDPDGLGSAELGSPVPATNANTYQFANEPMPRVAYDTVRGRAYLVYVDSARGSGTRDVFVRFSDDNGASWSAAIRANDGTPTARFRPEVAVDPATGHVAVVWFDDRGGPSQVWGTVLTNVGPPAHPNSPLNLFARGVSSSQITLNWTDTADNETGFEIERQFGFDPFRRLVTVDPNVTTFHDTGHAPRSYFTYRVRAINSAGVSTYSNEAAAVTLANPPAAPTNLTATAVSFSRIDLSWNLSADVDGYELQRSTDGSTWTSLDRGAVAVSQATDQFLTPETTYRYRVRAFNTGGDSPFSNVAQATTPPAPPAPPNNLTARAMSLSRIDLQWTDYSNDELGFKIERSPDGQSFTQIATVGANVTTFADTGLRANTRYYYRVRSFHAKATSIPSNTASAVTLRR